MDRSSVGLCPQRAPIHISFSNCIQFVYNFLPSSTAIEKKTRREIQLLHDCESNLFPCSAMQQEEGTIDEMVIQ